MFSLKKPASNSNANGGHAAGVGVALTKHEPSTFLHSPMVNGIAAVYAFEKAVALSPAAAVALSSAAASQYCARYAKPQHFRPSVPGDSSRSPGFRGWSART